MPSSNNKSVQIEESNNVIVEIDSWKVLSEEEKVAQWYSRNEMIDYRGQDKLFLNRLNRGELNLPDFCLRGLESRSADASFAKKTTVLEVVQAVLDEQDKQRYHLQRQQRSSNNATNDTTINNEQLHEFQTILAEVSKELSHDCRKTARKLGKSDSLEIPELMLRYKEDKKRQKEVAAAAAAAIQLKQEAPKSPSASRSTHRRRFADFISKRMPARS